MATINKIEDIYPITIVSMRYGDKFVILNLNSDNSIISEIELNEEWSYDIENKIEECISPNYFGIGKSINEAFLNYQSKQN